jgi:hypothetical protein
LVVGELNLVEFGCWWLNLVEFGWLVEFMGWWWLGWWVRLVVG